MSPFPSTLPPSLSYPASSSLLKATTSGTDTSPSPKTIYICTNRLCLLSPKAEEYIVQSSAPSQFCRTWIPYLTPCPVIQKTTLISTEVCSFWCTMPVFFTPAYHYSEICNLFILLFSALDLREHEHTRKTSHPLPPLLSFQNELYSFLLILQPHEFQHVSIIPINDVLRHLALPVYSVLH